MSKIKKNGRSDISKPRIDNSAQEGGRPKPRGVFSVKEEGRVKPKAISWVKEGGRVKAGNVFPVVKEGLTAVISKMGSNLK